MTFTFGNLFVEAYGSSDNLIDLYGSEDMDLKFWKSDSVVTSLNKTSLSGCEILKVDPVIYKRGYFGNDDEMLGRLMMSFSGDKVQF